MSSHFRNRRFWIPVIVSVPVTILCIIVSAVTADFGFKTYVAAMIFFPYMMLSTLWFGVIPPAIGIVGLFQWPLYGIIIGRAWVKDKFIVAVEILLSCFTQAASWMMNSQKYIRTYTWVSESILKLGEKIDDTHRNGLRITNASPNRISYLMVEVFLDKYVLFDVEPQSIVDLKFQFHGKLSCQGEFAESKQRFGSAVQISNDIQDKVRGDFSITIDEKNAVIKSPGVSLKETSCCAADRPGMNYENSWWDMLL